MSDHLKSLLRRSAATPTQRLNSAEVYRRARRVRLLMRAKASLLFVGIGAVVWLGAIVLASGPVPGEVDPVPASAEPSSNPSDDQGGYRFDDPRLDLSARVPDGWHAQDFDNNVGFVTHTGFVVSNVEHTFVYPDLGGGRSTSAWDMTDIPPNGVVIEVSRVVRFEIDCNSQEGNMQVTDFPLSLDDPAVIEGRGRYGSPPRFFIGVCLANGKNFGVHAWFFPEASARDRDLARQVISSIRSTS